MPPIHQRGYGNSTVAPFGYGGQQSHVAVNITLYSVRIHMEEHRDGTGAIGDARKKENTALHPPNRSHQASSVPRRHLPPSRRARRRWQGAKPPACGASRRWGGGNERLEQPPRGRRQPAAAAACGGGDGTLGLPRQGAAAAEVMAQSLGDRTPGRRRHSAAVAEAGAAAGVTAAGAATAAGVVVVAIGRG